MKISGTSWKRIMNMQDPDEVDELTEMQEEEDNVDEDAVYAVNKS